MGAKHYQKLGKTTVVMKVPEKAIAFTRKLLRELDEVKDPELAMKILLDTAKVMEKT